MKKLIIGLSLMLSSCELEENNEYHYSVNMDEPNWSFLGEVVYEDVDMSKVGVYYIVYEVDDVQKQATINIIDIHDPVIKLTGSDVYLEVGSEYVEPGYIVTDNYDTNLEVDVESNLDINNEGDYEITYSTVDSSGNTYSTKRLVHVYLETELTLAGESVIDINLGDEFQDPGYNVNKDIDVMVESNLNTLKAGTYYVKYSVEDIELIRTVNVVNNETIITLNGNTVINLELGSEYIEQGASINKDIELVIEGTVDTNSPGTYFIKYIALDKEVIRTINVIDSVDTILNLNGEEGIYLEVGSEYIEQGATVNKDIDIITEGEVDTNKLGTYYIKYKVNDLEVTRVINVVDTIAPMISLNGNSVTLRVFESYMELGAIVTDNYNKDIDLIIGNNVDMENIGTYYVTYQATDESANFAEVKREVKVIDDIKPVIRLIGKETTELVQGEKYIEQGVTVTDNYSDVSVEIIGEVLPNVGTYELTYVATDDSGNKSTTTRTVIVKEKETTIFFTGDIVNFEGTYYADSYGEGNSGNMSGKYIIDRVVNAPYPYLIRPINGTTAYGWTDGTSLTILEESIEVVNSVNDLVINQNILDQSHKKVGSLMTPTYIVIHNTANDASAYNEIMWLHNQNNTTYASFHFAVDESEIWQGVDLAFNAWHAGDGGEEDSYNRNSIGIEIARSTHPDLSLRDRATNLGAMLTAKMMMEYNIPIENVVAHYHSTGKWDPADIFERMGWENFLKLVESYLE